MDTGPRIPVGDTHATFQPTWIGKTNTTDAHLPFPNAFRCCGANLPALPSSALQILARTKGLWDFVGFTIAVVIEAVADLKAWLSRRTRDPLSALAEAYPFPTDCRAILHQQIRHAVTVVVDVVAGLRPYLDGTLTPTPVNTGLTARPAGAEAISDQLFIHLAIAIIVHIVAGFG